MEKINIESTPKTPSINFDFEKGFLEIKGRSIPENSIEFYKPIVESLEKYGGTPSTLTTVNIQLEYFNTSSSKCILDVFKKLESIHRNGNQLIINWYYEQDDEDMLEAGEDYQAIINVPFKMIQIPE
jgi:SiaC family regulatory phosphoprotein